MMFVYRPKRRSTAKVKISPFYRGRFRVDGMVAAKDVALKTSDKQVAEKRLRDLVADMQKEGEGLLPRRSLREAGKRLLRLHLRDFVTDLEVAGRDGRYIDHVDRRLKNMFRDCSWEYPRDLAPDAFQTWRASQVGKKAPKTLVEYQNALSAFCNWMVRQGRMEANPFRQVVRMQTSGEERVKRRALSPDESRRLLEVAGPDRIAYLAALLTGLRRGELNALVWADLDLDVQAPVLRVRAETAKNRRAETLPIHPELAAAWRAVSPRPPGGLVFPEGVPDMATFKRHLAAAEIPFIDAQGRRADFHALRKTLCTNLGRAGVSPWLAMRLMRHSDIRLTVRTYSDARQFPLREAQAKLPNLGVSSGGSDTLLDTPVSFPAIPAPSQLGTEEALPGTNYRPGNIE